jgi:hypothetical protein
MRRPVVQRAEKHADRDYDARDGSINLPFDLFKP